MDDENGSEFLTIDEACEILRMSRSTWTKWTALGKVPPVIRVGKIHRIRREVWDAWLAEHENGKHQK